MSSSSPKMSQPQGDVDDEEAIARRDAFIANLPKTLEEREDRFAKKIALDNASARSKLRKLHNFTDELMEHAKPYTACKAGCSHCCKINITISKLEAEHIERETGHKAIPLKNSVSHEPSEFNGTPCPFLQDDRCTIYSVRPYVCRKHVSFAESNDLCHPTRNMDARVPMVEFSGLEDAFADITRRKSGGILADIRDFFPAGT